MGGQYFLPYTVIQFPNTSFQNTVINSVSAKKLGHNLYYALFQVHVDHRLVTKFFKCSIFSKCEITSNQFIGCSDTRKRRKKINLGTIPKDFVQDAILRKK